MKLARAVALQSETENALRECYSTAKHFGFTSREMELRKGEVLLRYGIAKGPRWLKSHLSGYWKAILDTNRHADLVYGMFIEGRFYSTHRNRPDYYGNHGIEPRAFADSDHSTAGHYWTDLVQGERKPFFVSARDCLSRSLPEGDMWRAQWRTREGEPWRTSALFYASPLAALRAASRERAGEA